jgi:hypothetical protein
MISSPNVVQNYCWNEKCSVTWGFSSAHCSHKSSSFTVLCRRHQQNWSKYYCPYTRNSCKEYNHFACSVLKIIVWERPVSYAIQHILVNGVALFTIQNFLIVCIASAMASLWGCPWMHLSPSGCSAPFLTYLLSCLQSGFCVLHRLWKKNLQSPKVLGPLLGPFCAPDCVQARRGALTVIVEPEPFRLRYVKYPLAVTMQTQRSLFCVQPQLGFDKMDSYLQLLTGGYFQPPSDLPAGTAEPPLLLPAGPTAKIQISC